MKTIRKSVLAAGITAMTVTTMFAASSNKQGTEVVHYTAKAAMTNDGVEPSASGSVQATQATQGNSDKETLTVTAKGLTPSTDYSLFATTNGTSADVDGFTTDAKGGAKLTLSTSGKSKKNAGPPPTPLTTVTEVDIVGTNGPVLTADMTSPSSLKYMVKKQDTTGNVTGNVNLSASTKSAKLNLTASGLSTNTDYILTFNGGIIQTNTSDSKGNLKITTSGSTTNGQNVLSITEVDLEDSTASTTVWSTPIP